MPSTLTSPTPPDSTLILGGGIIGLSTAYYLSIQQPTLASSSKIHIIDSAPELLLSASAYAGGFLAKDWFSPHSASLGALSFRLHRELADAHDGRRKWGYAEATSYGLSVDDTGIGKTKRGDEDWLTVGSSRATVASGPNRGEVEKNGNGADRDEMLNDDGTPAWITRQKGGTLEVISSEGGCAQVEPKELCLWLLEQVESMGVQIHLGAKVAGVVNGEAGSVKGLEVTTIDGDVMMQCKNIVISSGAWTTSVFKTLFPNSKTRIGIRPLAGYSIVVRSPRYSKPIIDPARRTGEGDTGTCHSIYCAPGKNWDYAPEAFSRMTKSGKPEIYIAGLNDPNMPLPPDVTGVKEMYDEEKAKDLKRAAIIMTGLSKEGDDLVDDDLEMVRQSLCLRPVSHTGGPIIAKVNPKQLGQGVKMVDDGGVFIASGHGPWGIALSLGTGLVVSELLQGQNPSADISRLSLK